jgi:hypothetical protein
LTFEHHFRPSKSKDKKMSAGQTSGTRAKTELENEKGKKKEIRSNREKARLPPQSADGKGVQLDEYKDNLAGRRPPRDEDHDKGHQVASQDERRSETVDPAQVDRPGFDLGGSTGKTHAGKGLGLAVDAKKNRKAWRLPR